MNLLADREALQHRHNLQTQGDGDLTLLLVHGYGCSQDMWRKVAPQLAKRAKVVLMDLVGFGSSDFAAYDLGKYATLDGHAADIVQILETFCDGPTVVVGHSAGAMMGLLAELQSPAGFAAHAMVAPTPCVYNDGDYRGGYEPKAIEELLTFADVNFSEWSTRLARLIAGTPEDNELSRELAGSFCHADPRAARQLARASFTMDLRPKLARLHKPTLIVQSAADDLAYVGVGEYMQQHIGGSRMELINTVGHCPHITAPGACYAAIDRFLKDLL